MNNCILMDVKIPVDDNPKEVPVPVSDNPRQVGVVRPAVRRGNGGIVDGYRRASVKIFDNYVHFCGVRDVSTCGKIMVLLCQSITRVQSLLDRIQSSGGEDEEALTLLTAQQLEHDSHLQSAEEREAFLDWCKTIARVSCGEVTHHDIHKTMNNYTFSLPMNINCVELVYAALKSESGWIVTYDNAVNTNVWIAYPYDSGKSNKRAKQHVFTVKNNGSVTFQSCAPAEESERVYNSFIALVTANRDSIRARPPSTRTTPRKARG